ncbi:S2611 protein, partial [Polyodon spathula]|nr:S2611 protein [Polyodon spathula]
MKASFWYEAMKKKLPILVWLPKYSVKWLQMDLIAGMTVGLTVVPQALAYAEVAGLPVQYGLYSSFIGCFIYCLLGTSKDVTLGPTAIMSLLCASYIGHDPVQAVLLTFLCGFIQLVMAIMQLGFLLDFISYPVIKGFTSSAALTIGFGQVKNILGLHDIPQQFFLQFYYMFRNIYETRVGDLILGLTSIALLVVLKVMKDSLALTDEDPAVVVKVCRTVVWFLATARNALVVVVAALVAYACELSGMKAFTLTGKTTQGLPPFKPPQFYEYTGNESLPFSEMVKDLGGGLAVIPLVGLLESLAIAKAFASQNEYRIDSNQELLAIGVTNLLGSFFSAYPVTGSFGRTAVNSQTGVCTPAGGIITGVIVLLSLAFLMPLFYYIPKAALAAVIICAVAPMFDYKVLKTLWKVKMHFLPLSDSINHASCHIVFVSFFISLQVSDHGVLVIALDSGLNFPAAEYLSDRLYRQALLVPHPRSVVLDCRHVSSIDYTVVNEIKDLLQQFHLNKVSLIFAGLR